MAAEFLLCISNFDRIIGGEWVDETNFKARLRFLDLALP